MVREVRALRKFSRWISIVLLVLLLTAAAALLIMSGGCETNT